MSDLYHGEYPVDMTPAEARAEIERREVKHSPAMQRRINDLVELAIEQLARDAAALANPDRQSLTKGENA